MIRIQKMGRFELMYRKLVKENPDLIDKIIERIKWFLKNPQDTRLDNHPLTGHLQGKWAFSITDDIRIVYEWMGKNTVRFLAIGGHNKVYQKIAKKEISS